MKSFLLFIVALILFIILLPFGILYSIVTLKLNVGSYFLALAKSIDQTGNVVLGPFLNKYAIRKGAYQFGDEDDKISYVIAMAFRDGNLKKLGWFIHNLVNWIDPGHFIRIKLK